MTFEVRTDVPYGNACDVSIRQTEDGTRVSFAPDPHGGPETLWFCFRLARTTPAPVETVRLVLKHVGNMLGGNDPQAMRPVVRYAEGDWTRLDAPDVAMLPDGRREVVWEIDPPEAHVDVAYCYPYGLPEVEALVAASDGYWRMDAIGISQGGRPLVRLSNDGGEREGTRPGLYLISRQHSGETPGSWVLDGFLRHVAAHSDAAPLVWAVPLTNIDGVEGGDYGKDNFPYDLNRAWGHPPMRHEVLVYQNDMRRWATRCRPAFAIDFHAPGACETSGVYAYMPDPACDRPGHEAVLPWIQAVEAELTRIYAAEDFTRVARYPSRWETPNFRVYAWHNRGVPAITFETPYAIAGETLMTRAAYREAGVRIAAATLARLKRSC